MGLFGFGKSKYQKNLDRFNFYVNEIIGRANAKYSTPDCMPYLKMGIDRMIQNSRSTIENWTASTNVDRFAHTALYNIAFDVLRSGQMHIHRGMLNPMLPCDKLLSIVDECLDFAVKSGEITKFQAEDQKSFLHEEIATVG